jgi:TonB-linked SusC/RagA family outer membrane protein
MKNISLLLILLFTVSLSPVIHGQNKTVTGTVTSQEDGLPLPGVNVIIAGTTTGTVTDIDGSYTVEVSSNEAELQFSYVGYLSQIIRVGEQAIVDVVLEEETRTLDEVVVIGYGIQKKSDLTSAVTSVSSEDVQNSFSPGIETALQGRAAGVQVMQNTGAPGQTVSVRIRGISSTNNADPLYIVDGISTDASSVNPADIESIEILKDAAAAAIYGAQGANGVILITTKQGTPGAIKATFNYYHGWQKVRKLLDLCNGPEFAEMYTEYQRLSGDDTSEYEFPDPSIVPSYDYQEEIFRVANMDNYDFSVSGGNESSTYMFSGSYMNQEGIVRNSDYNRLTLRLNTDYKINNWLKIGERISFVKDQNNGLEEWMLKDIYWSPVTMAIEYHPFVPVYTEDGNWTYSPLGNTRNPVASIELLHDQTNNYKGYGNVYLILEPIKGLTYENRIGAEVKFNEFESFKPVFEISASDRSTTNSITKNLNKWYSWKWLHILTFSKSLFDVHNILLMGGFEAGYDKNYNIDGTRNILISEDEEMWYFNASVDPSVSAASFVTGGARESTDYSYFGRFNYDYKGKYLFTFNFRRDGSSKFGPENRFGNFPSFSAGWKFSEENFVKNLGFLSFGKIRGGWGKVGNAAALQDWYSYYSTVGVYAVFKYNYENNRTSSIGAAPDKIVSRAIHWEAMVTKNLGIDLAFLNNRLSLSADIFERHNDGLILQVQVPGYWGTAVRDKYWENGNKEPEPYLNVGKISNKGFEFVTGWKDTKGKLKYSADFNFSYVKNIAEDLNGDSIPSGEIPGFNTKVAWTKEGKSIGEFYGFRTNGLFGLEDCELIDDELVVTNQPYITNEDGTRKYAQDKAQPGDIRRIDTNGDSIINNRDIVAIGNPNPRFIYGLSLKLQYGPFDLDAFWQGTLGNKIFNATKVFTYNSRGAVNWGKDYYENHYVAPVYDDDGNLLDPGNTDGTLPRIDPRNANNNLSRVSDFFVEDGSYLRLKSLQIGYALPSRLTKTFGISLCRFYVGGRNLLTLTKYSGYDPEVGSNGILVVGVDTGNYPQARMYTVGVNVEF